MKRHAVAGLRVLFSIIFLVLVEEVLRDGLVTIVSVRLLLGRYLEAEYCTDGLVFIENLEVFVNQDDSFLQVIDELLSTPLLNKLFLELVQILPVDLIFFQHEDIKKNLQQQR